MSKIGKVCRALLASVAFVSLSAFAEFVSADRQLDGVSLPKGYTLLEYVSATAKGPYVDTGIYPDGTTRYELAASLGSKDEQFLLGSRDFNATKWAFFAALSGKVVAGGYSTLVAAQKSTIIPSGFQVWSFSSADRLQRLDGVTANNFSTLSWPSGVTSTHSIYLFALNNAGTVHANKSVMSVSRLRIWQGTGDTPALDYVPAKFGNEVGFYDLVAEKFVKPVTGSGSLVAGPDVATDPEVDPGEEDPEVDPVVDHDPTLTYAANESRGAVTATVGGSATASGAEQKSGSAVVLTATPADGYEFAYWSGALPDGASATANPLAFEMPEDSVSLCAYFTSTNRVVPVGWTEPSHGVLLITFDDNAIDSWLAATNLFARYDAHASFAVISDPSGYGANGSKLMALKARGHTVGLHTWGHVNTDGFESNPQRYFEEQVKPQLDKFTAMGHTCSYMAYPNNKRTEPIDEYIRKHSTIRHFRAGEVASDSSSPYWHAAAAGKDLAHNDAVFTPVAELAEMSVLNGMGCAVQQYGTSVDVVKAGLGRIAANNEVMVLFSHDIRNSPSTVGMSPTMLEDILATAKELGVRVVGADEIPYAPVEAEAEPEEPGEPGTPEEPGEPAVPDHPVVPSKPVGPQSSFVPADRQLDGVTLPEGYTLLSAVSSTGEQYVDLEVEPDDTTAYEITLRDDTDHTDDRFVLGAREAAKTKAYYFAITGSASGAYLNGWAWYLASGDAGVLYSPAYYTGFNVVDFTAQHRVYVNNQFLSQMDVGEVVTGRNLYLFTVNNNGVPHENRSKISVRRIKIWKGGLLVRDCVGAVDSNEVIGLYDLVSGRFFVSATEVGLRASGPDDYVQVAAYNLLKDVRLPADYEQLDYVSSTGEQYFDTEIVPDETVTFDLAFRNHETTKDTHLFGSRLAYENNAVGFSIQKTVMRTHFSNAHLDYGSPQSGGDLIFRTVALTASHAVYVDGARGTPLSPTVSTIVNPNPIYLFNCNDNGKPHSQSSSIDLRNCRIWKGGELVRNYVPARHGGEVGLYDLVSKSFKPADSETPLVAGPAVATDYVPPEKQLLGVSLPGDYVLLSHVQSLEGNAYFDTGVTADETTAYEVTFRDDRLKPAADAPIIGSRVAFQKQDLSFFAANKVIWCFGDFGWTSSAGLGDYLTTPDIDFCVVKFESHCFRVNNSILNEAPSSAVMAENGFNIYLLSINNNGQPHKNYAQASLRRCRLWKAGRLVRDYVPAWRKADGVVGLYDLVEKGFRLPAAGVLMPGRPINAEGVDLTDGLLDGVKLPAGHRLLDYVWSTGTQYINTGVTPDETVTYEVTYRNDGRTANSYQVLGSRTKFRENALALSIQRVDEVDKGFACHFSDKSCYAGGKLYFDGFNTYSFDSSRRFAVDGVLLNTLQPGVTEFSTELPIYVFNINDNGAPHTQPAVISVRRLKIWKGGKLVRDYVPDYFENKAGLFDRVEKKFYPADQGELLPGPDYVPLRKARGLVIFFL